MLSDWGYGLQDFGSFQDDEEDEGACPECEQVGTAVVDGDAVVCKACGCVILP